MTDQVKAQKDSTRNRMHRRDAEAATLKGRQKQ